MTQRTSDYVRAHAAKARVSFTELWVVDIHGRLRGQTVTAAQLDAALEDGEPIAARVLGVESDEGLLMVPDPATWAVLPTAAPGAPPRARILCDLVRGDGGPCPWDARGALKRVLGRATDRGYTFYVGAQVAYYYVEGAGSGPPAPLDHGPDYGLGSTSAARELALTTVRTLEQLGTAVNGVTEAAGPGQIAMGLAYADALAMADALVTHRRIVTEVARSAGHTATFMPFPFADGPGSALELTLSLIDNGESAFYDGHDAGGRSAAAHEFAAGVDAVSAEACLIRRSTINSYNRPASGPVVTAGARGAVAEDAGALRFCGADASTNPYLMLAVLIDAGLAAILHGAASEGPGRVMPVTLAQAADVALRSIALRRCLGEPLLEALVASARADGKAYRAQVTPWELARYL